jgi:perosamine synthetase
MEYKKLEKEYAKFVGSKFAVSCNSGTSALHLALLALNIGKGDEVIVPDFTMAACGFAVSYTGANVITVDCGMDFNIDPKLIEAKITPKTKAIMAVHIYGRLCDMDKILKIANKHNLKVIEDACEAQGAVYESKADITCYSFYSNKIISAEEGGICTTNNEKYADRMNYLKNMAFSPEHDYHHKEIGYNYRMPNAQAKLALKSLRAYPENEIKRRKIEGIPTHDAVWVIDTLCESEKVRDLIVKNNTDARYFFKPLSTMPMWKQEVGKNALKYSKLGFYLTIKL